jgi:hypothetical protein
MRSKQSDSSGTDRVQASEKSASQLIDARIRDVGGWRGQTLARMRALILEADPEVVEEWKWRGTPVWSHGGIICTGETYTKVVKLTFAQGARLADPARLFNSSLEGNTRRAIDIHEGEQVDAVAFKTLVKAAADHNGASAKKGAKKTAERPARKTADTLADKPAKKTATTAAVPRTEKRASRPAKAAVKRATKKR